MLLFASYVLLTLGGTRAADPRRHHLRRGQHAVVDAVPASAVAVVYAATGSLNLAQLAGRLGDLPDGVALVLQLLLLVTFAIKAAVFPLSFWLPDSYPTAPAPVTAVFAGLLTKVGVYAILRVADPAVPRQPADRLLLVAALLTMVVGILGAIAQSDLKRMLSFTLVSHIGYMVFGIGAGHRRGLRRRDLLRRPPHHHPDRALPRPRARRAVAPGAPRCSGWAGWPGSRRCWACCSSCPRMNLAGHPADVGLPRQGRTHRGRPASWAPRSPTPSSAAAC